MTLDPISQFNLVTILGVFVVFVATLLVLRKTFFGPVIAVIERRDAKIEKGRRIREDASRLVADAQAEAEKIAGDAVAAREDAIATIKADIAAARATRLGEATVEAEAIVAAGRLEVEALRESERARMDDSLTACVIETLSTVLDEVDERRVRGLVAQELAAQAAEKRGAEERSDTAATGEAGSADDLAEERQHAESAVS